MKRDEIRLECLKLAAHQSHAIVETLGRASEYEKFVLGADGDQEVTGNLKDLSPQAGRTGRKDAPPTRG